MGDLGGGVYYIMSSQPALSRKLPSRKIFSTLFLPHDRSAKNLANIA
jgi:hypothetical protein